MVELKCPVCGKHIHTLRRLSKCTECADINIYEAGAVHKTGVDYICSNSVLYVCPHCNYQDDTVDVFIHDANYECEHNELTCTVYDGFDIEICERCGMLISSEPVELHRMEPE